jgi:bacterioferritin-associated ferredoxin
MLAGAAAKKYGKEVGEQQEILAAISDLVSDIFLGESALLRTQKAIAKGASSVAMLSESTSLGTRCGHCTDHAHAMISKCGRQCP